jgi:hyperosmotically inducible periplasmic protein
VRATFGWLAAIGVVALVTMLPAAEASKESEARIVREVGHELRSLSNYGIFDNLTYQVRGYDVILSGVVTRPALKTAAEKAVKSIEGVEKLQNQIEVLPLSAQDDRIRLAAYQAIYGNPALSRYGLNALLPIHIIVKNGDLELVGPVATELDRNLAGVQVNSIAGVHSVKNSLAITKE